MQCSAEDVVEYNCNKTDFSLYEVIFHVRQTTECNVSIKYEFMTCDFLMSLYTSTLSVTNRMHYSKNDKKKLVWDLCRTN